MSRRGTSAGFTLVELVVATTLGAGLLLMAVSLLVQLQQALRETMDRMEWVDATRVAEARIGRAVQSGGDVGEAFDSGHGIPHRGWRGTAHWCGDGWMEAAIRAPDPARDSLWWADRWGALRIVELTGREPGGCEGAGVRLSIPDPADPGRSIAVEGGLVRWFERGRLRIDDAVRYGREGAPAQPLTPAILASGSRVATASGGEALELLLIPRPDSPAARPAARRWLRR